jgi:thioredoxin 1
VSSVKVIEGSAFETEIMNQDKPVLAYFWASWCGPCRLVSPSIEWASDNYSDRLKVVKLEVDKNKETVARYQVEGVPALILFKDETIIASHEGAMTKQQVQGFLENHI